MNYVLICSHFTEKEMETLVQHLIKAFAWGQDLLISLPSAMNSKCLY
jgi:hypothetical protein